MPRDGSNVWSPPAGTTATPGTSIESAKYNALVSDLTTLANEARPVSAGGTGASTAGAALTALGAQPLDADLTAIAGLTSAADRLPYYTGAGTAALATFTAAGRALVDDADAAAQRATLGLVIGTNVQAYDAALASLAGLSLIAGDLLYATGADTLVRLPKGTASQLLQMNAGATAPEWVTPAAAGGMTLLGTLTTTSGTTQTLSGLTLTDYKMLRFMFDGVGYSGATGATITLVGITIVASTLSSGRYRGIVEIDLATGAGYSIIGSVTAAAPSGTDASDILALRTSVTTATTSVSITSSSPSFVAGTVRVYGVK